MRRTPLLKGLPARGRRPHGRRLLRRPRLRHPHPGPAGLRPDLRRDRPAGERRDLGLRPRPVHHLPARRGPGRPGRRALGDVVRAAHRGRLQRGGRVLPDLHAAHRPAQHRRPRLQHVHRVGARPAAARRRHGPARPGERRVPGRLPAGRGGRPCRGRARRGLVDPRAVLRVRGDPAHGGGRRARLPGQEPAATSSSTPSPRARRAAWSSSGRRSRTGPTRRPSRSTSSPGSSSSACVRRPSPSSSPRASGAPRRWPASGSSSPPACRRCCCCPPAAWPTPRVAARRCSTGPSARPSACSC